MTPAWRSKLYEALDVDDTGGDDLFIESLGDLSEVELLSALIGRHMPPEDLEEVGDLVTQPNGEILYHRLLVLSAAPPTRDNGSFADAGVSTPPGTDVRYLMTLRDYAKKGAAERLWYYADGKLMSAQVSAEGKTSGLTIEVDEVAAYVDALSDALLEDE